MTLHFHALSRTLLLVLLAALMGLAGCADMSKSECAQADWRELGRQDAMSGQTLARFGRRAEACRKNGLPADKALYEAGHAQGQAAFCTPARGTADALAGAPPAALCAIDPVGEPYRQGHAAGLPQFCTAPSGFEYGRKGLNDNQVCPPDLAATFQIGFRLGHELYELNQRLADIQKQAADERAVLALTTTLPERRDAANRHLGQLDADEASTRKLIRQAERSALSLAQPGGAPAPMPEPVPTSGIATDRLPGQWRLASVSFNTPTDLNRDGVKSADGMAELAPCLRDRQLDLEGDQRALLRTGLRTPGCKPAMRSYRWRAEEGTRQDVHVEAGRRVASERPVLFLRLRGGRDDPPADMVVEDVDDTFLIVRGDMPDGTEATREAVVTYRRVGR
ncbi:MAG TPA: DUF2799 domain-containing protein [Burkholderiaceae bacterium]|nr:DUF2799 domain-containing protein [Burkholderiaceae bacterium]